MIELLPTDAAAARRARLALERFAPFYAELAGAAAERYYA